MRLYLLRHGEAQARAASDADRALTEAGRAAISAQCRWLEGVDTLVCSPYRRARQSAELVREQLACEPVVDARLTPDRPVADALALVQSLTAETALLVGHNPLLSRLAGELIGERHAISLPTAGLVCLEGDDWFPGGASLRWVR